VGMLLAALEGPAPAPDRAPEVVIRPVTHYHRDERRL
jgi:hypothetical protein